MTSPIDQAVEAAIGAGAFPGASILAFKKDQIVWDRFYGSAQLVPNKRALTGGTFFDIASLTKPMSTASLCMLAFQEGRLTLADPVQQFLPAFSDASVTLGHLLNHSSGLPAWKAFYEELSSQKPPLIGKPEAHAWVMEQICKMPLENPVGAKVVYSDLGYLLLGFILEKIYAEPLHRLFDQKVAKPLGLSHTFFNVGNAQPGETGDFAATEHSAFRSRMLCGEVDDDNTYVLGGYAGHAGLFSQTRDIHRWLSELQKARAGKSAWITADTFRAFCSIPPNRPANAAFFAYGFDTPVTGSQAGTLFSLNSLGHLGYAGTSFWWDLDRDFGIVFLTNRVHPDPQNQKIRAERKKIQDVIVTTLKLAE